MPTDRKIPNQINFAASMFQIFFKKKLVIIIPTSKIANQRKSQKILKPLLKKEK